LEKTGIEIEEKAVKINSESKKPEWNAVAKFKTV